MYSPKTDKDIRCPLEYALDVFGGRWKSRVLCMLRYQKSYRYGELKTGLGNISDAALATTLKELMADEVISRRQYNEMPLRVEYSLTEKGESIVPILEEICSWGNKYYGDDRSKMMTHCVHCEHTEGGAGAQKSDAAKPKSAGGCCG